MDICSGVSPTPGHLQPRNPADAATQNSFDFIHSRNLAQSIGDWPKLLSEIYKSSLSSPLLPRSLANSTSCIKPGGYIELGELGGQLFSDDDSLGPNNAMKLAYDLVHYKAMASIGRPPATAESLHAMLEEAGFVDVHVWGPHSVVAPRAR